MDKNRFIGVVAALLIIVVVFGIGWKVASDVRKDQHISQMQETVSKVVDRITKGERILDLPEDGKEYHLSLLLHDDWKRRPAERRIVMQFDNNPALRSLKSQCYYHVYTESSSEFQRIYSGRVNSLPSVVLQSTQGDVALKMSGQNIPEDDEAMVAAFTKTAGIRPHPLRPWLNHPSPRPDPDGCPDCKPKPKPKPNPDDRPLIPDTVFPEPPAPKFPWALLFAACAITALVVVAFGWVRRTSGK